VSVRSRIDRLGLVAAREFGVAADVLSVNVTRIDTDTLASERLGGLDFVPADFAFARGAMWASAHADNVLVRLDPHTGDETARVPIGRPPGAVASTESALWVALFDERAVARYDLEAGDVTTIDVGGTPNDLVAADESVWVAVDAA
jgi:hypothetical protein